MTSQFGLLSGTQERKAPHKIDDYFFPGKEIKNIQQ